MKSTEAKEKIDNDPDFVYIKRFDFSLRQLVEKHPGGVPDRVVAAALMLTEDDVEEIYNEIVVKLREAMKVE